MPDRHSPEQRSYNMFRIRSQDTAPERRLGELLALMFPTADLIAHPSSLPGRPDWVIPSLNLALFADGCFFHRCPRHFVLPEKNRAYWSAKIARNRIRDRQADLALAQLGYLSIRIWEHDLRKDLTAARRKIRRKIRERRSSESGEQE